MIPLDVLTRQFSPDQVKQREGRGGKMLDYLETHAVITRLNESFEGAWSFEVLEYKLLDAEVLVRGRLTAGGQRKEQFGGSEIARRKDTGDPVSLADDLKSAGSDCLKKCATLFGVGLELYTKGAPQAAGSQQPSGDASRQQVGYIRHLMSETRISVEGRQQIEREITTGLSRNRASAIIETLKGRLGAYSAS